MSVDKEIAEELSGAAESLLAKAAENLALAKQEVKKMLSTTSSSIHLLCINIEKARNKDELKAAFSKFNAVIRIFLEAAPSTEHDYLVRDSICAIPLSQRLRSALEATSSVPEALTQYKSSVVAELAKVLQAQAALSSLDDEKDDELLLQLLPEPTSPPSEEEQPLDEVAQVLAKTGAPSRKRRFSAVDESVRKTVQTAIPALASIPRMQQLVELGCASKKQALLTREKLRAGMSDPRGLLRMVSSSSNALERTKQLEILKSSGFGFEVNKKSLGKTSFSDQLAMATTRLDLGLGGHALSDTLLFGAKVLSMPGVLSVKNITDIENNTVDAKTTWRHQKAYVQMVIAGCLNQARNILEKFDEILDGPAPEELVGKTHEAIRELLASQDCRDVMKKISESGADALASGDEFLRRIIEAVSPIIPITLRNKSLDSAYFRTALQLMAAAEFMFAQFESDVRIKANPAGAVGMCNNMHAEMKRATVYNDALKPVDEFIKDMKGQYQTSLGLGASFVRDSAIQGGGRGRKRRGRGYYRNRYQAQNFSGGQDRSLPQEFAGYSASRFGGPQGHTGYGRTQPLSSNAGTRRDPAPCFAYQAGNCTRGRSCKFSH